MIAVAQLPFTGFEVPLEVIVLGTITGLTYSLLAVGLVLAYKSSRVLNFAHGEMGALAATVVPLLVVSSRWPYWAALIAAVAIGVFTGWVIEFVIIRHFARSSRLIVLVATIGMAQLFFALSIVLPKGGADLSTAQYPTPFDWTFTVGILTLGPGQIMILIAVPLISLGLWFFLQSTRIGLASRCASENSDAAQLLGVPVRRISLVVWSVVGVLAATSAVLVGATRPIVSSSFTAALGPSLLVRALAAAMIAGLSSLPLAFGGGIVVGIIEALVIWNYPRGGTLEVVLFVLIVGSLLVRRGLGSSARGGEASSWSLSGAHREMMPRVARLPRVRLARAAGLTFLVAAAALLPAMVNQSQQVLMSGIVLFAAIGLSLVVLTGFAGQVSLGQFAFVGLGALVGGRTHQLGYPWWMCLGYATMAGAAVALLVGIPALRIRGLLLAVATLSFAVAFQIWVYAQSWLVNTSATGTSLELPRPHLFGIDLQPELRYYWVCLAAFVALALLVHRLRRSGIGRAMMAVRDNEAAAASLGISPQRTKLTAFVLAGAMAAFAGYFYGGLLVSFPSRDTFSAELSLALVGLVILGGVTSITGAVLGAVWLKGLAYLLAPLLPSLVGGSVALVVGGAGLLAALYQFPGGIAEVAFGFRDRVIRRISGESGVPLATATTRHQLTPKADRLEKVDTVTLAARGITVRFGGNTVLDAVTVEVKQGEIVGLVGPNGAGKTTFFDVLAGHLKPGEGSVFLHGMDVTRFRPERRAQLGLGRTFQQARLFNEMRLVDCFKVGLERSDPSEALPSLLGLRPARRSEARKDLRADEIVELLGLGAVANLYVSNLSTGTRRLAELGCMIALGADVLLLDEPTAGIAQREVEAFRPVFRDIRDHLGATMVVIEHDIPMIMELVDRLYVLSAGHLLAEGPPRVLREDPAVIAAYLGTDERMIQRSGKRAPARGFRPRVDLVT